MVKLRVKHEYQNQREHYRRGQEIEVEDAHAAWLQRDAPGSFEVVVEKAPRQPARDKMMRNAPEVK